MCVVWCMCGVVYVCGVCVVYVCGVCVVRVWCVFECVSVFVIVCVCGVCVWVCVCVFGGVCESVCTLLEHHVIRLQ